jgi:hypothetical protein
LWSPEWAKMPWNGSFFPFSLTGRAKQWYSLNVRSMEGVWESLQKAFCLIFFPTPQVVKLRREVICFEQRKTESLGATWARFMKTVESGLDLDITEPIILQHFHDGLGLDSAVFLDSSSGWSFTHLTLSGCKDILGKILKNTPYTGGFDEFPDEEEPMSCTLSEPKLIEEEHTFPTIQSVEDCTPLTKHGSPMNHSNYIEKLTTPHVISSTSCMMSYLINIGRRILPEKGKRLNTRERRSTHT